MAMPEVADMPLQRKIGQLFVVGFDGTQIPSHVERFIDDWGLGGVIFFSRNITTPTDTKSLTGRLQARAKRAGIPPLFVAVDQEGGPVSRLNWGTDLPSAMAIGATRDEEVAFDAGKAVGSELRSLGINLNLAPVLDVNNNPDNPVIGVRSFGEDPDLVGRLGSRFAAGLRASDVLASGKHFPGHGDTVTDSHHDLPVVSRGRDRLDRVELPPFRRAVSAGLNVVMTAHVSFPALTGTDDIPATVSRPIITGLLRDELEFDGLVITDCLEMNAIADGFGTAEAAVSAIEAGCDLLTISHTPETQAAGMGAVYEAVQSGRLTEERIDESVERILRAKRDCAVPSEKLPPREPAVERVRETAVTIATEAVTLVRDREDTLPVDDRVTVVTFPRLGTSATGDEDFDPEEVANAIESSECSVERRSFEGETPPVDDDVPVVVATIDALGDEQQARTVRDLSTCVDDLIVISLRNPYDLTAFPDVDCYLTTYDYTPASLDVLGSVLGGGIELTGTLPVSIPLDVDGS